MLISSRGIFFWVGQSIRGEAEYSKLCCHKGRLLFSVAGFMAITEWLRLFLPGLCLCFWLGLFFYLGRSLLTICWWTSAMRDQYWLYVDNLTVLWANSGSGYTFKHYRPSISSMAVLHFFCKGVVSVLLPWENDATDKYNTVVFQSLAKFCVVLVSIPADHLISIMRKKSFALPKDPSPHIFFSKDDN